MRRNTANVASVHNAEMAVARQSRVQKNTAKDQRYQRWIMSRPAEYWDAQVERRAYCSLRFNGDSGKTAAAVALAVKQREQDVAYQSMVVAMLDMVCEIEGLSHKWEFPIVADAAAAMLAQLKRQGGSKAAWAHKQKAAKVARIAYKAYETVLVRIS